MDVRALYAQQLAERGLTPDPGQSAIAARLEELRRRVLEAHETRTSLLQRLLAGSRSAPEPVRGLYLWGPVGRGKTWLMDLFCQALPESLRLRRHFHRVMHDVHARLGNLQAQESPLDRVAQEMARQAQVLCFDELFVSDIADAMILGNLFSGLFRHGMTLVATSNVHPRELYKEGLQRQRFLPAIELIEQHTDIVALDGSIDYRLRRLTQAGTYLLLSELGTPQRLEQLFRQLSDGAAGSNTSAEDAASVRQTGAPEEGCTLEIEGRPIPCIREGGSVVWFGFTDLCAGPRSQNDYIEIAREYQSVIVSDVPVFDATTENEARRFIALVDELYDRNVNLVVSAATSPEKLYQGDRLTGSFARTASRLIEMQSAEYLARPHRP